MIQKSHISDHFRPQSNRLLGYDYSQNGAYFVTICVKGRECVFGMIENQEMVLNEYGKMAENIWKEIKNQFEFVELDQFIVMPNHIHGIIVIAQNQDAINRVSTTKNGDIGGTTGLSNPMLQENLGKIIRWYKGRCSFELRKIRDDFFSWQSNYHERIIRTESELQKIRQYIYDNPANWQTDEENISPTS